MTEAIRKQNTDRHNVVGIPDADMDKDVQKECKHPSDMVNLQLIKDDEPGYMEFYYQCKCGAEFFDRYSLIKRTML